MGMEITEVNMDPESNMSNVNGEVKGCEVKQHSSENMVEITELLKVEECKEQDALISKSKAGLAEEKTKCEAQKMSDDSKKPTAFVKPTTKSAIGSIKAKYTVPQPFVLATEKRALCGTHVVGTEPDGGTPTIKSSLANSTQNPVTIKENEQVLSLVTRKPLRAENKKHPDEDDSGCVVSSYPFTEASAKTSKPKMTSASAPVFRSSTRAERRKEFYSKLEEKHLALEAEKTQWEVRTKLPPTRAKSPKLGRRKSCSDTNCVDKGIGACGRGARHSLGNYKDIIALAATDTEDHMNAHDSNSISKVEDESISPKTNGQVYVDIAIQSSDL
ncbi:hypothetical protein LguiB_025792 [Lonicera macranthoides]